jgi:dipeptidyl aminopeptidase/acylaminoacyl peptidase
MASTAAEAAPEAPPGRIAFTFRSYSGLSRLHLVRPDGRGVRRVTRFGPASNARDESAPAWRPDGRLLAFTMGSQIWVVRPDGRGARRVIAKSGVYEQKPAWSPDGRRILFVSMNGWELDVGATSLSVVNADGSGLRDLVDGSTERFLHGPGAWSPDGETIVFSREPADSYGNDLRPPKLVLMNADGTDVRPLGSPQIVGSHPRWSPDGKRIAFVSERDHNGRTQLRDSRLWHNEVYVVNADGSGLRRITRTREHETGVTWSPGGKRLVFVSGVPGGIKRRYQLWTVPVAGGRPRLFLRSPGFASEPDWSLR